MSNVNLLDHFEQLPDPRIERTKKYPLREIILLIISASISGCCGWKAIKDFGDAKLLWLRKYCPFEEGIPTDDTIARVVRRLSPQMFKKCFLSWIKEIALYTHGDIIAIDGKTVRGSHDHSRTQPPLHMVSAWSNANNIVLGQEKTQEKSNEITAIPKLLEFLDLKDCIVTIDAMGCQKDIASALCHKGADYIFSLKGNQGALSQDVKEFFEYAYAEDFLNIEHSFEEDIDTGHGRLEHRRCWAVRPAQYKRNFRNLSPWKNLETIVMIKSTRDIKGKTATETRFYISSCSCDAKHLLNAIRKHWSIESMHWILDVTFREDHSRIRKGDGPENCCVLRHIALNTMKKYNVIKDSIKSKIRKASFSDDFRSDVLKNVLNIKEN